MTWCRTAYVNAKGTISLETIADRLSKHNDGAVGTIAGQIFDLTQSVDWMEYLEKKEDRQNDEGGAGAYDTMRCDIILPNNKIADTGKHRVIVWGQDYHLQRLHNSFLSLVHETKNSTQITDPTPTISSEVLSKAMEQSHSIISELLAAAESSVTATESHNNDTLIQLFRVTLLWSKALPGPVNHSTFNSILVRGHATSSCKLLNVHDPPEPIVVSIAAHHTTEDNSSRNDDGTELDKSLPTRHANPQNKIASWCRLRKQMEKPTYKPPGVSEVLMVRQRLDDESNKMRLEVLEGLSSNFFAIYKDGSLRTATEGVLNGYVRHLVLGCASKVGLQVDPRPIFLSDAPEWSEAFITSSSRLIYPISKVIIPDDDPTSSDPFSVCWTSENVLPPTMPKWKELLQEVLRTAGYD